MVERKENTQTSNSEKERKNRFMNQFQKTKKVKSNEKQQISKFIHRI